MANDNPGFAFYGAKKNIEIRGKKNSLFPEEPVFKWLVI